MAVLEDLITGTQNGKIIWVEHTIPIPNTYLSHFGPFRADISPTGVKVVRQGILIADITEDFEDLTAAVEDQRNAVLDDATNELNTLISAEPTESESAMASMVTAGKLSHQTIKEEAL